MIIVKAGTTSVTIPVFIQDSASTTGAGKTGLAFNTAGWKAYYVKPGSAAVAITLATQTATGAWSSGGFCEIDATNMPGWYRLDVPNAALSTGSGTVVGISLCGATGAAPCNIGVNMVAYDPANSANLGLSNLATYTLSDIIDRLPAALVGGRMDSNVQAMADDVITAAKIAADAIGSAELAASAISEIQSGLSTLDAAGVRTAIGLASANLDSQLTAIDDFLDTEIAAIKAKTDNLPASPAAVGSAMTLSAGAITAAVIATDAIDADALAADAIAEIQSGLSTLTAAGVRTAIGLASANLDAQLDAIPTAVENAAAVQSGTSLVDLAVMVTGDGTAGAKFTTTALSNAPSGGGGGGSTTIVIERQIRLSLEWAYPVAEPFEFVEDDAYTLKAFITDNNANPVNLAGFILTASATNALTGVEIDAPTVTAYDTDLGIVEIAITSDLTGAELSKGWLSVKLTDGTDTHITTPTQISVRAR